MRAETALLALPTVLASLSPILADVAVATLAAAALAFVARALGQPLILAYVAAGVLLGDEMGFGLVVAPPSVEAISSIGLVLLLFLIGLEIDVPALRRSGKAVLLGGLLQVPLNALLLTVVPWALAATGVAGSLGRYGVLYLSFALSLSSTLVVVKILYDKFELDTLPGRITLGILVAQDLWAILFLALQPSLSAPQAGPLLLSLGKGVAIVLGAFAASKWALPHLFRSAARAPELLILGALAWCFLVAGAASHAGLSAEMGALIAGLSLGVLPYKPDIAAKVTTVRDFFLTLFFVSLGLKVTVPTPGVAVAAAAIAAVVLLSRFVVLTPLLRRLGLGSRVSLVVPTNLWPVSEFALVLTAIGLNMNPPHVSRVVLDLVLFAMIASAVAGTYLMLASDAAQKRIASWLARLGVASQRDAEEAAKRRGDHAIVLLGFHRTASALLYDLERTRPDLLPEVFVVDFNPVVLRDLVRRGVACGYGDLGHPDTLRHAGLEGSRVAVCTIPDTLLKGTTNLRLLSVVSRIAPEAKVIATAETAAVEQALLAAGAAAVIVPPRAVGDQFLGDVLALLENRPPPSRPAADVVRGEVLG